MLNPSLKDLSLASKELKKIAKLLANESMTEDELLGALKASEAKINFFKRRIEKIREKLKE